jgi:tripartite-type tricarboxylate transporter receptor subunit TctC
MTAHTKKFLTSEFALASVFVSSLLTLTCPGYAASGTASEQHYPDKPIRIVVGYAPGGGSDFVARVVAQGMTVALGQSAVVDNRPGAAGLLGTQLVANAPSDGYTLLLADTPFALNNSVYSKPGYDPIKSFAPITQIATTPLFLVVNPSVPAMRMQEFIAMVKAQPKMVTIAMAGLGSISHLAESAFAKSAGLEMTFVPYKGAGPAITDLMGGQVQSMIATAPSVTSLFKSGKMRVLAVTSKSRTKIAPEVPTMEELGIKNCVISNWYAMVAPAGTAANIVARLHNELVKIVQQRDVIERFSSAVIEAESSKTPQEFGEMIAAEAKKWAKVAKDGGIRID